MTATIKQLRYRCIDSYNIYGTQTLTKDKIYTGYYHESFARVMVINDIGYEQGFFPERFKVLSVKNLPKEEV